MARWCGHLHIYTLCHNAARGRPLPHHSDSGLALLASLKSEGDLRDRGFRGHCGSRPGIYHRPLPMVLRPPPTGRCLVKKSREAHICALGFSDLAVTSPVARWSCRGCVAVLWRLCHGCVTVASRSRHGCVAVPSRICRGRQLLIEILRRETAFVYGAALMFVRVSKPFSFSLSDSRKPLDRKSVV